MVVGEPIGGCDPPHPASTAAAATTFNRTQTILNFRIVLLHGQMPKWREAFSLRRVVF
jgi:hypothetical protein